MITVFGCPVNSDYLETLLKNAGYDPSDESGVVKIVATNDGKITAHWPDGTTSELVGTASGTDEKVKTTSADSTEGYLGDKIDDDTIVVDTASQTIKVASGKFITAGSTIDWDDVDKTGSKLSDLGDVPSYDADKVLGVDSSGTTLQWVSNAGSTAGVTEFTGLSDTPSTYSGHGTEGLRVKSDESALEFVGIATAGHTHTASDVTDFDTEVSNNTDVAANTAARHTHSNKTLLDSLTSTGSGTQFLADDGNYDGIVWGDVDKTGSKLSDIEDVPSYQADKVLGVDSSGTTLQWISNAGSTAGVTEFTQLSDTPSTYSGSGSYYVAVKSDESGLEFVSSGGTGASTFLGLTDTPSTFSGEATKAVVVKDDETGLEFTDVFTDPSNTNYVMMPYVYIPSDFVGGTGYMKITTPISSGSTQWYQAFDVVMQKSYGLSPTKISLYGHTGEGGTAWGYGYAYSVGSYAPEVRFGVDSSGKFCIWIGTDSTSWDYTHVSLIEGMFYPSSLDFSSGWGISVVTATDTVNIARDSTVNTDKHVAVSSSQTAGYLYEVISGSMTIDTATMTLQLDGDDDSPGSWKVYGTDGNGLKGWFARNLGDRGFFACGRDSGGTDLNVIDYVLIQTQGNAADFGDAVIALADRVATSNGIDERGVIGGGTSGSSKYNNIDYITINVCSNASDFGDLTVGRSALGATSNRENNRGVFASGFDVTNVIDYITISTIGNASDFGDLSSARYGSTGASNHENDRGVFGGGYDGSNYLNNIEYITISTTSNSSDFGDLTSARARGRSTSNGTYERALWFGGEDGSSSNVIDYITISTTGDATDFGDLSTARKYHATTSNAENNRAIIGGGDIGSTTNSIEYVNMSVLGNSIDFGDLTIARTYPAAGSNA